MQGGAAQRCTLSSRHIRERLLALGRMLVARRHIPMLPRQTPANCSCGLSFPKLARVQQSRTNAGGSWCRRTRSQALSIAEGLYSQHVRVRLSAPPLSEGGRKLRVARPAVQRKLTYECTPAHTYTLHMTLGHDAQTWGRLMRLRATDRLATPFPEKIGSMISVVTRQNLISSSTGPLYKSSSSLRQVVDNCALEHPSPLAFAAQGDFWRLLPNEIKKLKLKKEHMVVACVRCELRLVVCL